MSDKIYQKAKRILKNFDFTKDNHCISLVGEAQGHAANGYQVITLKSVNSQEETIDVKKALEQISVNLSFEEYLRVFFNMWSSDAEVLAKLLGFETEHEAYMKERESSDSTDWEEEHEKWIAERVSQFTLMKSVHNGTVETLTKSQHQNLIALQEKLEPALQSYTQEKEKQMDELEIAKSAIATKEAELATQTEVVKSLNAQVEALQAEVNLFKSAKETAEQAAFTESLKGLVADEKLESVAKALFAQSKVDAEGVATIVETLKATKQSKDATVEASGLLTEQSHSADVDVEKARNQKLVDALNADAAKAIR